MKGLFVGTSGFAYAHWEKGVFYPPLLPKNKKLEYYSQYFKTVELNNSFYHLPKKSILISWQKRTPKDFIFSLKTNRVITHLKKLVNCQKEWKMFLERVLELKEKLGPILFQLPPFLKKKEKRLKEFIEMILKSSPPNLRFAFEFRNQSWCDEKIYQILKEKNCAWVISDSPSWPKINLITANFVYLRMHGAKILFSSKYTDRELKNLSKRIKKWLKEKLDVYCYFNNDAYGYAPENAKKLLEFFR